MNIRGSFVVRRCDRIGDAGQGSEAQVARAARSGSPTRVEALALVVAVEATLQLVRELEIVFVDAHHRGTFTSGTENL